MRKLLLGASAHKVAGPDAMANLERLEFFMELAARLGDEQAQSEL